MEFEPLFDAGLHDIAFNELEDIFVKPFSNSQNRDNLVVRLKYYLSKLREIGIYLEIWLDGSFATKKREPADIDIAIFAEEELVNNLDREKKERLRRLVAEPINIKLRYKCHVYFCPKNNIDLRSQWKDWFGFDREKNPKGIPRLMLGADSE